MDILVIARKRGFWKSPEAREFFDNITLTSRDPGFLEFLLFFLRSIFTIAFYRPRVIILGTSMKMSVWLAKLIKYKVLPTAYLITDNQHLSSKEVEYFDKVIVYSKEEMETYGSSVRPKLHFIRYPGKGDYLKVRPGVGDYLFCGGNNKRDHVSFVEAMRGLNSKAVLVSGQPLPKNIPHNVEVYGALPMGRYLDLMAGSRCVVVPLVKSKKPHGHSDIATAVSMGKPIISTKGATVSDYIRDGVDGILVEAGDVVGYKEAILKMVTDDPFYESVVKNLSEKKNTFSHRAFGKDVSELAKAHI